MRHRSKIQSKGQKKNPQGKNKGPKPGTRRSPANGGQTGRSQIPQYEK